MSHLATWPAGRKTSQPFDKGILHPLEPYLGRKVRNVGRRAIVTTVCVPAVDRCCSDVRPNDSTRCPRRIPARPVFDGDEAQGWVDSKHRRHKCFQHADVLGRCGRADGREGGWIIRVAELPWE